MSFDVKRLQGDLRQIQEEDWIEHFVEQNYEGEWSVVPLRGPANATRATIAEARIGFTS